MKAAIRTPTTAAFTPRRQLCTSGRRRSSFQKGSNGDHEEKSGKKNCNQRQRGERHRAGRGPDHRAQVGGEGEQRAGKSLRGAVSGEEVRLIDPAAGDHGALQQRKNDMASAEDQRAAAVEGVGDGDGLAASGREDARAETGAAMRPRAAATAGRRRAAPAAKPARRESPAWSVAGCRCAVCSELRASGLQRLWRAAAAASPAGRPAAMASRVWPEK